MAVITKGNGTGFGTSPSNLYQILSDISADLAAIKLAAATSLAAVAGVTLLTSVKAGE